jgi:hypothetical protein
MGLFGSPRLTTAQAIGIYERHCLNAAVAMDALVGHGKMPEEAD